MIYYKAVRPDGTSFYDGTFRWLPDGWQARAATFMGIGRVCKWCPCDGYVDAARADQ